VPLDSEEGVLFNKPSELTCKDQYNQNMFLAVTLLQLENTHHCTSLSVLPIHHI
jgi:hypothetical protein